MAKLLGGTTIGTVAPQNSTSNATGSLQITGGLGVSGNVYSGRIVITGASNGIIFVDSTSQTTAASPVNYSEASYGQANAATNSATAGYGRANASFIQANAAFIQANAANNLAQGAFDKANTASTSADQYARDRANAAFVQANSTNTYAFSAYTQANAAFIQANAAFTK